MPVGNGQDARLVRRRDVVVASIGYLAAIRPAEWPWVEVEHVEFGDGAVRIWLPSTKTGEFQHVDVTAIDGLPDPTATLTAYLAVRGDEPGPLLVDGRGHGPRRVATKHLVYRLRSAAAAAVRH